MLLTIAAAAAHREPSCGTGQRLLAHSTRCALASLLVVSAATGAAQAASKTSHFVLDNGMEIVVVPNHRVPIVHQTLFYKVGASEDPAGDPGVAHFLEHMMFKGTQRFPGNYFQTFTMANGGGSINGTTTLDMTYYPQSLPKQHLAALMELEADRMVNLQLPEDQVAPELRVVANERRGNENSPAYLLMEGVRSKLYPDHPYNRSGIGTEAEIAKLDRAKALAFYQRYYGPSNAVLLVAGDVEEGEVRALAEKTFGSIPHRELGMRVVHPLPRSKADRVEMADERVGAPNIGMYYLTPGLGAMPQDDAAALALLCEIANRSLIGRFQRRLIIEQRVAVAASAGRSLDVQAGTLTFTATAAPGVSATALEAALAKEVAALARDGVTETEADDARRIFLAQAAWEDDNPQAHARTYGSGIALGMTVADINAWNDAVARVTRADINRVADKYIAKAEPVIGVLLPKAASGENARAAGGENAR
jgi:zinc protease